ncbi:uncharacterized protein LY89DRAFT_426166 [Mollisia scopiformis]|uniref:Uncharacterized protein n=1 Tax=Mollisia scopiformis TaxID=149040 RepID=A0A194XLG6_MOLSC|nr:uncharacterized protein LY89DRAFT_426166 [Mollisia scopiformis]KUJ21085.1 hypothetical protein LY89DRAFT_426166 [Mollisia scopiformis]
MNPPLLDNADEPMLSEKHPKALQDLEERRRSSLDTPGSIWLFGARIEVFSPKWISRGTVQCSPCHFLPLQAGYESRCGCIRTNDSFSLAHYSPCSTPITHQARVHRGHRRSIEAASTALNSNGTSQITVMHMTPGENNICNNKHLSHISMTPLHGPQEPYLESWHDT